MAIVIDDYGVSDGVSKDEKKAIEMLVRTVASHLGYLVLIRILRLTRTRMDQMSALSRAILEPPHGGKRPDILQLLEDEERADYRA